VPALGTAGKNAPFTTGEVQSDTQLTALTPDFGDKGNVAIVQVQFGGDDLTTTF